MNEILLTAPFNLNSNKDRIIEKESGQNLHTAQFATDP